MLLYVIRNFRVKNQSISWLFVIRNHGPIYMHLSLCSKPFVFYCDLRVDTFIRNMCEYATRHTTNLRSSNGRPIISVTDKTIRLVLWRPAYGRLTVWPFIEIQLHRDIIFGNIHQVRPLRHPGIEVISHLNVFSFPQLFTRISALYLYIITFLYSIVRGIRENFHQIKKKKKTKRIFHYFHSEKRFTDKKKILVILIKSLQV